MSHRLIPPVNHASTEPRYFRIFKLAEGTEVLVEALLNYGRHEPAQIGITVIAEYEGGLFYHQEEREVQCLSFAIAYIQQTSALCTPEHLACDPNFKMAAATQEVARFTEAEAWDIVRVRMAEQTLKAVS